VTVMALSRTVSGDYGLSPEAAAVAKIADSKELSKEEKIAKLKELALESATQMVAIYRLDQLDGGEATKTVIGIFRAKGTTRERKLRLGYFALGGVRPQRAGFPREFVKEFADYLIGAILDGGEKEFCRALPDEDPTTAVGEYAYLASDFDGYKGVDFAPFMDARVVPILIRCLDAPDNVYPEDQGDCIRGKPGEPTGRNTARQQIPAALAKLGDARAIEPLKRVLFKHADMYERMNAACALAQLVRRQEDRAAIGKEILAREDLRWCRLPFGEGLIKAGDDAGVEFLAIKHAGGYGRQETTSEILYMLDQRLSVLQGFRSPKVETFVREALAYKPWRAMILFEPGSVKIDAASYVHPPKDEAEALELSAPRIIQLYGMMLSCVELNGLAGLSADLEQIGKQTRSEKIREMTGGCLKALGR